MPKLTTYQKIEKYLFTDDAEILKKSKARNEVEMNAKEIEILHRARAGYSYWLERPEMDDSKVVDFISKTFNVSVSAARYDVYAIKKLHGNVYNAGKEFHRYTVIKMFKEAYALAVEQQDPKAMAMAGDKLGKYTKCDQNELEELPWDQIIPPNFLPTPDVSVLDKTLVNENIEEKRLLLRAKYKGEDIQEVDYEEVKDE